MLREIHTALVGSPDGKTKGINTKLELIEVRHQLEDEANRFARWKGLAKEGTRIAVSFVSGILGGNAGR